MKTKINLTIEEDLISKSKAYAKAQGKSVSQLVEDVLGDVVYQDQSSFVDRWKGRFKVAEKEDVRYEKLTKRYSL